MSEINNEWVNWIEEAISKRHIKHYEYKEFKNIQEIGIGGFGKFTVQIGKIHTNQYFALKSLLMVMKLLIKEFDYKTL